MRVSDDRYNRDRLRLDLAMRLMRHGARTRTICDWTAFSEDRIRKLYHAYQRQREGEPSRRLRGKAPQRVEVFLETPALAFEATTLACLLCILGLLPKAGEAGDGISPRVTPERGEAFCQAYETYAVLHCPARLSFEDAWYLLLALLQQDKLKLCRCGRCERLYLAAVTAIPAASCGCDPEALAAPRRRTVPDSVIPALRHWST
jgi:hypothetical protein